MPNKYCRGDVHGLQVVLSNRLYFRWSGEGVQAVSLISVSCFVAVHGSGRSPAVPRAEDAMSAEHSLGSCTSLCLPE